MQPGTRSRRRRPDRGEHLGKPHGLLAPRMQAVGPEHFGIVAVNPAKARSYWLLADFYGRVLIPLTVVEHTRSGFDADIDRLKRAIAEHDLRDTIVAVEQTGSYHRPVKHTFAAAGFDTRIVHPSISRHYRQAADYDTKTDATDTEAGIFRDQRLRPAGAHEQPDLCGDAVLGPPSPRPGPEGGPAPLPDPRARRGLPARVRTPFPRSCRNSIWHARAPALCEPGGRGRGGGRGAAAAGPVAAAPGCSGRRCSASSAGPATPPRPTPTPSCTAPGRSPWTMIVSTRVIILNRAIGTWWPSWFRPPTSGCWPCRGSTWSRPASLRRRGRADGPLRDGAGDHRAGRAVPPAVPERPGQPCPRAGWPAAAIAGSARRCSRRPTPWSAATTTSVPWRRSSAPPGRTRARCTCGWRGGWPGSPSGWWRPAAGTTTRRAGGPEHALQKLADFHVKYYSDEDVMRTNLERAAAPIPPPSGRPAAAAMREAAGGGPRRAP